MIAVVGAVGSGTSSVARVLGRLLARAGMRTVAIRARDVLERAAPLDWAAAGAEPPVPAGSTLDPQAVSARPRDRNTAVTAVLRMRGVVTPGAFRFVRQDGGVEVPGCLRAAVAMPRDCGDPCG